MFYQQTETHGRGSVLKLWQAPRDSLKSPIGLIKRSMPEFFVLRERTYCRIVRPWTDESDHWVQLRHPTEFRQRTGQNYRIGIQQNSVRSGLDCASQTQIGSPDKAQIDGGSQNLDGTSLAKPSGVHFQFGAKTHIFRRVVYRYDSNSQRLQLSSTI
jgi:hypothetical protein